MPLSYSPFSAFKKRSTSGVRRIFLIISGYLKKNMKINISSFPSLLEKIFLTSAYRLWLLIIFLSLGHLFTVGCSDSVTGIISKDGGILQQPSESPKYLQGIAETNQVNLLEGMVLDVRFGFSAPSPIQTELTWTITRRSPSGFSGFVDSLFSLFSQDFVNESGSISIAKDQTEFSLRLEALSDDIVENKEEFELVINSNILQNPIRLPITLEDQTPKPTIHLSDQFVREGQELWLEFRLSNRISQDVSFDVVINPATSSAVLGTHYQIIGATRLTIPTNQLSARLRLVATDDNLVNDTLQVNYTLNNFTQDSSGQSLVDLSESNLSASVYILDNDVLRTLSINDVTVQETSGQATLRVSVQGGISSSPMTFKYSTMSASAAAPNDFPLVEDQLVTIPANTSFVDIVIPIIDDSRFEGTEVFSVILKEPSTGVGLNKFVGQVTILDNDPEPSVQFALANSNVNENVGSHVVSIQLTSETDRFVSVPVQIKSSSTATNQHHGFSPGVFMVPPGVTEQQISIPIINDTLASSNRMLILEIPTTGVLNAALGSPREHSVTIIDDDGLPQLFVGSVSVSENVSSGKVQIPVYFGTGIAAGESLSFDWTTLNGTAQRGQDFQVSPWPPSRVTVEGPASQVFLEVNITNDTLFEGNEYFDVQISALSSSLSGASILSGGSIGRVTIQDDEAPPMVQFAQASTSLAEGSSQSVQINLSRSSSSAITIPYSIAGSAGPSDFVLKVGSTTLSSVSGQFTIPAGSTQLTFTIEAQNDSFIEGDETFSIQLAAPVGADLGSPSSHQVTINDASAPPTISIADASDVVEGGNLSFPISLSAPSQQPIQVTYTISFSQTPAASAADINVSSLTGTINFLPTEQNKILSIPTIVDSVAETDEFVVVTISSPVNATLSTSVTGKGKIVDSSGAVNLSVADASVTEGGNLVFTISMLQAASFDVTVSYATADGNFVPATENAVAPGDYESKSGSVTIPAGQTTVSVAVSTVDDAQFEADEKMRFIISNPSSGAAIGRATAIGTITNNDSAPILNFAQTSSTVQENETGAKQVQVVLGQAMPVPVTFEFSVAGSATAGLDYVLLSTSPVTIPAGSTSVNIQYVLIDDELSEPAETILFTLSNPSGGVSLGSTATHTVSIQDNDQPSEIRFGLASSSFSESAGSVNVSLTINPAAPRNIQVPINVSGSAFSPNDHNLTSQIITIPQGATSHQISVNIVDDNLAEGDETIVLSLGSPSLGGVLGTPSTHTLTIEDNDTLPTLSISNTTAIEGQSLVFPISLSSVSGSAVTFTYTISDGTATSPGDYEVNPMTGSMSIPAGQTTTSLIVPTKTDSLIEGNETVTVTLSAVSGANSGGLTATGTIQDANGPVEISVADASVEEGINLQFVISIPVASTQAVTVSYATADGNDTNSVFNATVANSDFTSASGTVTIPAGQTQVTITVPTIEDTVYEENERMRLILSSPSTGARLERAVGIGTIINDDSAPVLQFAAATSTFDEGAGIVQVSVQLAQALGQPVTVPISLSGTANSSQDYLNITGGSLTFNSEETTKNISISLINDELAEPNETIVITLGTPTSPATLGTTVTHTLTIQDNDSAPTVIGFNPPSGDFANLPNSVVVNFSRPMNTSTVTNVANWNITCTSGGSASISSITHFSSSATVNISYSPQPNLNGTCTLTATTNIQDVAGNGLGGLPATRQVTYTRVADVLRFQLSKTDLIYNETINLSVTGGVPPYTFSKVSGGGSVSGNTYTAGTSAGTVRLRVQDNSSQQDEVDITVYGPVTISPETLTLNVGGSQTFTASGGKSPYTFSLPSGGGVINSSTGAFTAGTTAGVYTVRVVDALGQLAEATVNLQPALALVPNTAQIRVGENQVFSVQGGVAPFTFEVISGLGTVNSSTRTYTAPNQPTNAIVKVTDSSGATAQATVEVIGGLPDKLAFITAPQTIPAGNCSGGVEIGLRDSYNNLTKASSTISVNLASAGLWFYSDSLCQNNISSVNIIGNTDRAQFFFKGSEAGVQMITATTPTSGIAMATQLATITANAASMIGFSPLVNDVVAGACSLGIVVSTRDSEGNLANPTGTVSVNFNNPNSVGLFQDASCNTALSLPFDLTPLSSSKTFYVKRLSLGAATITGQATGFTSQTLQLNFVPGTPHHLAFLTQPSSIGTINTDLPIQPRVGVYDEFNNLVSSATNSITLKVSTDSNCAGTAPLATATVNPLSAVSGQATFSGVKMGAPGIYYLKAEASGVQMGCSTPIEVQEDFSQSLVSIPNKIPSDNLAEATLLVVPVKNGNSVGSGQEIQVHVAAEDLTKLDIKCNGSTCGNCNPSVAGCFKAFDHGQGSYSMSFKTIGGVAQNVTFNVKWRDESETDHTKKLKTIKAVASRFDTSEFTAISANTNITKSTHGGKNLYFTGGVATFQPDTENENFGVIWVRGGTLTHLSSTTTQVNRLSIYVSSFVLQSGSIDVSGKGYPQYYSYGATAPSNTFPYGGHGGECNGCTGRTYGDYRDPWYPGSANYNSVGGGVIRVTATGLCTFNSPGTVRANGGSSGNGAAGGSIYFRCGGFSGSLGDNGIQANGVTGQGGGRIALISTGNESSFSGNLSWPNDQTKMDAFVNRVQARGGTDAGAGTIYLKHSGQTYGSLIVANGSVTNGVTRLQGISRNITAISGSQINFTPPLPSGYGDIFKNIRVRPRANIVDSTPNNLLDDPIVTVNSNTLNSLTVTGSLTGVQVGDTVRTLEVLDQLYVTSNGILKTESDIVIVDTVRPNFIDSTLKLRNGFLSFDNNLAKVYPSIEELILTSGTYSGVDFNEPDANVTISGATLNYTGNFTVKSLSINNGNVTLGTATILGNYNQTNGNITVSNLSITGNFSQSGGTLTHPESTTTQVNRLIMTVGGSFTLSGGSIDVSGKGYPQYYSYGATAPSNTFPYGGHGGECNGCTGRTYGDYRDPWYPGSANYNSVGGGVIRVTATGLCTFNSPGTVRANGGSSGNGAAGGSIYFRCGGFSGSLGDNGIQANGVTGQGGGRIALISTGNESSFSGNLSWPNDQTKMDAFVNRVQARGGTDAGAGTIYLKHSGIDYGGLIVHNGSLTGGVTGMTSSSAAYLSWPVANTPVTILRSRVDGYTLQMTQSNTPLVNRINWLSGHFIHIFNLSAVPSSLPSTSDVRDPLLTSNDTALGKVFNNNANVLYANPDQAAPWVGGNISGNVDTMEYRTVHMLNMLYLGPNVNLNMHGSNLVLMGGPSCNFVNPSTTTVGFAATTSQVTNGNTYSSYNNGCRFFDTTRGTYNFQRYCKGSGECYLSASEL